MIDLTWLAWAGLLVVQNAAFTLVSRARNSSSLVYHAAAALGSNGVWFASQFLLFGFMLDALARGTWLYAIALGGWYSLWTIVGSVGMHYIALTRIEPKVKNV
jgi:hypothetical protein